MTDDDEVSTHVIVQRILVAQIVLIATTGVLFMVAVYADLGFFWFAFLAGVFGGSLAFFRRVQKGDRAFIRARLRSWGTTLMPFLYGGMMAGVAYFLFASQVLSGKEGEGLLAMNLFPDFNDPPIESGRVAVRDWLDLRPKKLNDAGKLIVWCFLAGYSESFVSGILQRLEQSTAEEQATDE